MKFIDIVKDIFSFKNQKIINNSSQGGARRFLSKISGAFMLPVSIMAIAGLFLGVGAALESHTSAKLFGTFIKNMGDPIFGAMPLLFMVAIVISFTDDIGSAVFSGIIAFLVFNAIQGPFIETSGDGNIGKAYFLKIKTSDEVAENVYKIAASNLGILSMNTSIFGGIVVGFIVSFLYKRFYLIELPSYISFFGGKRFVPLISIIAMIPLSFLFLLIWPWIGLGLAYFGRYSGKVSGLDSFVFGFVERSLIPFGLHHVFYAPLWWTSAGGDVYNEINNFEGTISSINEGKITTNSAALDTIKDLINSFNEKVKNADSPMKKTLAIIGNKIAEVDGININDISGELEVASNISPDSSNIKVIVDDINANITTLIRGDDSVSIAVIKEAISLHDKAIFHDDLKNVLLKKLGNNYQGDSFGWLAVNRSGIYNVTYNLKNSVEQKTSSIFEFISNQGLRLGRFMQGKYSFMQLGLPAAGLAMIMTASKENRKMAASVIVPASITSFVTGVTEPIEFTFLFLAPYLFWGFHALMAAFSFLFMNLLGAHVGMTFSGGIIDTIIYGAIPFKSGTNFYWMYVIGLIYAPIYYFVFYFVIKKFNLSTPGRGENTKLFTKKDYLSKKYGGLKTKSIKIIKALGGWNNIIKFDNCATRLRYDVKDMKKVNEKALKIAGAHGVMKQGKSHVQIIVGTEAEQINANISSNKGTKLS